MRRLAIVWSPGVVGYWKKTNTPILHHSIDHRSVFVGFCLFLEPDFGFEMGSGKSGSGSATAKLDFASFVIIHLTDPGRSTSNGLTSLERQKGERPWPTLVKLAVRWLTSLDISAVPAEIRRPVASAARLR
jgi:hypothetical protein